MSLYVIINTVTNTIVDTSLNFDAAVALTGTCTCFSTELKPVE